MGTSDTQPAAPSITPQTVRREVRDFLRSHEQRRRQIPRAVLVGLLTGLLAVAFRHMLHEADGVRDRIVETAYS
jgi:hypothetical protein